MKCIHVIISAVMLLSGCATVSTGPDGAKGPEFVHSYQIDSQTQYVQVGMKFSSMGDFVALVNPSRWSSPLAPGGSLSWVNPAAWRHDWQRTGRIFIGEAAMVGVGAAAAAGGGGGGGGGGSSTSTPTPPTGGGGGAPPPPPPPPSI